MRIRARGNDCGYIHVPETGDLVAAHVHLLYHLPGGIALGSAGVWNESDQSDEEQGSVELPGLREEGGDSMSEESGSLDSHHLEPSEDTEVTSLQTGSSIIEKDGQEDEGGFLAVSLRSIEEDVEKGKAASLQIGE